MSKRITLSDIELSYLRKLVEKDSKPSVYISYQCITLPAIKILQAKLEASDV